MTFIPKKLAFRISVKQQKAKKELEILHRTAEHLKCKLQHVQGLTVTDPVLQKCIDQLQGLQIRTYDKFISSVYYFIGREYLFVYNFQTLTFWCEEEHQHKLKLSIDPLDYAIFTDFDKFVNLLGLDPETDVTFYTGCDPGTVNHFFTN